MTNKFGKDFSSGIFAFFINDFQFSDSKIGAFKFYYDSISDDFIVKDTDFMTDDEEKEDEDGFSIIAMWNWERKNYFIKE